MKLYTRTGDAGSTSLFGGGRVSKMHPRVVAYGAVDELSACLGMAVSMLGEGSLAEQVKAIQHQMFTLGADLATPRDVAASEHVRRLDPSWIDGLEASIDLLSAEVPPLQTFIIPGGSAGSAALHVARTVCRRAERDVVAAVAAGEDLGPDALRYLNRLADWLFAAARVANARAGREDERWVPPAD